MCSDTIIGMLSEADGRFLVRLARAAIETWIKGKGTVPASEKYPVALGQKAGIFVSIHKRTGLPAGQLELAGCIGLPYPVKPLVEGVIEAATAACQDSRFARLKPEDLPKLKIEVSVLSEPEEIKVAKPKDYLKAIKPGQDGLIIRKGVMGGLFLPVVWEQFPKPEDFLAQLCFKAGLLADAWLDPSAKIYRFRTQVFSE